VLGHERRLQPLDERREASQVGRVDAVGAAEREPDAVDLQRMVASDPLERAERRSAPHVVLGMDLEKADAVASVEDVGRMLKL
jgi:hypothetical protein